ncbi:MAG: FAD:protein FMN transferase [Gammaproteobacteria bacterium]|nr:MAG: FAD:protein FMN transferase [Gammaproteobacteria bacterium]
MKIYLKKNILILFIAFLLNFNCHASAQIIHDRFINFGTEIDIKISNSSAEDANAALKEIRSRFNELNDNLNPWTPGNLYSLNKAIFHGEKAQTSADIIYLIKESQLYNELSLGNFEPSLGKLTKLWGFDNAANKKQIPDSKQLLTITKTKPSVKNLTVIGYEVSSSNNLVQLDFGGIAKGLAVDIGIQILQKHNIHNATINAGGDLKAIGMNGKKPWTIGISNPFGEGAMATTEAKSGEAIFTSGNYERAFKKGNKIYHHIIDPDTGMPSTNAVSSTVITKSGAKADAAATALMVAKPSEWVAIINNMQLKYVMLVDKNGQIFMTPEMKNRTVLNLESAPAVIILQEDKTQEK